MLNSKFWAKYFRVYDALNELIPYQELMKLIVDKTKELAIPGGKILDLGSGTGNLTLRLEENSFHVSAIDFSKEGIILHKEKNPRAEVLCRDIIETLPYEDNSFDGVVTNNVIYTLSSKDQEKVFREVYRVVRSGGFLVSSNLAPGFKAIDIYNDHIKKSVAQKGFLKTVLDVVHFLIPTIKIFYYNILIKRQNSGGSYNFLNEAMQEGLLRGAGFKVLGSKRIYGNQAVCTWAQK